MQQCLENARIDIAAFVPLCLYAGKLLKNLIKLENGDRERWFFEIEFRATVWKTEVLSDPAKRSEIHQRMNF